MYALSAKITKTVSGIRMPVYKEKFAENNIKKDARVIIYVDRFVKKTSAAKTKRAYPAFMSSKSSSNEWYVDSGASSHMTAQGQNLHSLQRPKVDSITAANNQSMKVKSMGKLNVTYKQNEFELHDVLHIPKLSVNLLSVTKMVENGNSVTFQKKAVR